MDILEKMEAASRMPTPPVQWCAEAAREIVTLRNSLKHREARIAELEEEITGLRAYS